MSAKTAQERFLYRNETKEIEIEVMGFQSEDNIIVATIAVRDFAGVKVDAFCPFKAGHQYAIAEFEQFASEGGHEQISSTALASETVYTPKTLTLTVVDENSDPVEGATVLFNGEEYTTDSSGEVVIENAPELADQPVIIGKTGYAFLPLAVTVSDDTEEELETYELKTVTFTVTHGEAVAIEGAEVIFNGESVLTDASGEAVFNNVYLGADQPYVITAEGYTEVSDVVEVTDDEAVPVTMVAEA